MSMNVEIKQQQSCIQFRLYGNKMIQDVNSAFSPDQSVLSFWSSAELLHAAPPSLVQCTNPAFGHQRRLSAFKTGNQWHPSGRYAAATTKANTNRSLTLNPNFFGTNDSPFATGNTSTSHNHIQTLSAVLADCEAATERRRTSDWFGRSSQTVITVFRRRRVTYWTAYRRHFCRYRLHTCTRLYITK